MHPENVRKTERTFTRRIALRNSTSKAHCREKLYVKGLVYRSNDIV